MIAPQLLISGTVCPDLVFQFEVDPTEKPIDVAKGNGRIFYEVVNRGRKLRQNERDPRVTPSDPSFEYFVVARAGVTATSPNQIVIHRPAGFDGGAIYEFTYPARHPVVNVGQVMAVPLSQRTDLFLPTGDDLEYTTRNGDNYFNLAFTLGVNLNALRDANGLWRLQTLPPGQVLTIPLAWTGKYNEHRVELGDTLKTIADARKSQPWRIIRDNTLFWDESLSPGMVLKVRPEAPKPSPQVEPH